MEKNWQNLKTMVLSLPRRVTCFIAGLLFVTFVAAQSLPRHPLHGNDAQQHGSYVYVLRARYAFIQQMDNGDDILILNTINPKTLYFSKQSHKKAGYIKTSALINKWSTLFANNLLDGAWVHVNVQEDIDGMLRAQAIQLSNPQQSRNGALSFVVKVDESNPLIHDEAKDIAIFIEG